MSKICEKQGQKPCDTVLVTAHCYSGFLKIPLKVMTYKQLLLM